MIQGFQRESRGTTSARRRRATSTQWRAYRLLVVGEVGFLVFTGVCIALHPGFVLKANEGGLSDYGVHLKTTIPYTLSLVLLSVCDLRAAFLYSERDRRTRRLRLLLFGFAGVIGLVLLSTYVYTLNSVLKELHYGLGTLLIVVVTIGSIWMYRLWPPSASLRLFLLVQLVGDALNLATSVGALHVLCLAELLSNIGFALILIRTGRNIALEVGQASPKKDVIQGIDT
jgi:hypothetical protein